MSENPYASPETDAPTSELLSDREFPDDFAFFCNIPSYLVSAMFNLNFPTKYGHVL